MENVVAMFGLTEEQEQLRKEVRAFAEREVAPHVSEWDEKSEFPHKVVKKLGEMGLMGVIFPEELGGAGMGYVEYVLAVEELSRVDGSVGIIVASHNSLCTNHIILAGNDAQKKKYVTKLASGEWLGAWGLTEPGSGSDAGGMRTTAVRGDGGWVLNGSKTFITNGTYADCALVLAVTDKEKGTRGGISAFVVEKGTPGFRPGKKENKLGLRASDTAELIFENCVVPEENLVGEDRRGVQGCDAGAGWRTDFDCGACAGDGARRAGCGGEVCDCSGSSLGRRSAEFQAIQFKLADMATQLDAAWLLTMRAAQMKDKGQKVTMEAAMAKLYASEAACRICDEGVQIHGGYGFIKDYPAEKFYRDVKLCTIGEGTSEIQRIVISRELLKAAK